jgi:hypothetical protein
MVPPVEEGVRVIALVVDPVVVHPGGITQL